MVPIHELLARMRWDPEFGRGEFELAYLDRMQRGLVRVPLREVEVLPGHEFIRFSDAGGVAREVPLHRVREVYRDGRLIWRRDPRRGA
ncbi:MAG TPA: DUF504 domain-containing protein [Burkholderiales bacterium]|nr:DUF504 domain-containing protein [Burkholderiales bacterium]